MSASSRVTAATPAQAITDDHATIEAALAQAHLPPLLAALAQATGNHDLLRADLRPNPAGIHDPQGGLSPNQQAAARDLALAAIAQLRAGAATTARPASVEELHDIMNFLLGEAVSAEYLPLLVEELAVSGKDLRAPTWHKDQIAPERDFRVAIIGAGMSGLAAAHRLQQAGVPYVILEKNADVGGTWWENRYPGCRVDVPNHLYSYSFAQQQDWPARFSPQEVLLSYFRTCADSLGVRPNIRLNTEVLEARFDESDGTWELRVRDSSGVTQTLRVNAIVSAVGQLNRPKLPDIAGRELFAGRSFHSGAWDHGVDLTGKRVAVIGTGASAIQVIPAIAERVAQLDVYQRTPNWFFPTPDYYDAMPDGMQWLLRHVPHYSQWYRFWLFWRLAEGALPAARVDPDWPQGNGSISATNDVLRAWLTDYLEKQFADAPELARRIVPTYPPLAKRILLDNGIWARTLKRENVDLINTSIERITTGGVVTSDGTEHETDVIIYATGFAASRFLMPMRVTGRDRIDLHEHWDGDARAYLGITAPRFPNLFFLYGPNTNLVANGSITFFSECEVRYILGCIRVLLERGAHTLDCRQDVFDAYNERVDSANAQMAWGASSVNSWYKNERGRITQNWPFSLLEFWQRTREPDLTDFDLSWC